jgi:hypothetical protein
LGERKKILAGFSIQIHPSNNQRLSIYLVIFFGNNRGFMRKSVGFSNALP